MRRIVRHRALVMGFAVALSVALVMGPIDVRALLQSAVGGPSPASGHAQVIAQGVSALPAKTVAWRVGERSARPLAQAPLEVEPLGFVLAQSDPILVNDATTNAQARVAGGEALFVPGGDSQQRAGAGDRNAKYMTISLVSSENAPNPDNVFPAPDGLRDIDLLRDVLAPKETTTIAASDAPILVLVTAGSIVVTTGGAGGPSQTVAGGAAAIFKGGVTLANPGTDAAIVVAGVIGAKVPPAPRFTGSLAVQVYACTADVTIGDLPAAGASGDNPCAPVDAGATGVELALTGPAGATLALADAEAAGDSPGAYVWTPLLFGAYTVTESATLPAGYGDQVLVDSGGGVIKDGGVSLQSGAPDVTVALYLLTTTTGSISASVFNCPPGMTAITISTGDCTPVTEGFDLALTGDAPGTNLGLKDAALDGGAYTWADLPLADGVATTFTVSEVTLPVGFESSLVIGAAEVGGVGSGSVNLSAANPASGVEFYNFQKGKSVGTITVDTLICPDASGALKNCQRGDSGPGGLGGVSIAGSDSGTVYSEANATQEGSSPYVWAGLGFGDYAMDTGALIAPAGYEIVGVQMTPDGADPSTGFTLGAGVPTANIIVLLAPDGGTGSATPEALLR